MIYKKFLNVADATKFLVHYRAVISENDNSFSAKFMTTQS